MPNAMLSKQLTPDTITPDTFISDTLMPDEAGLTPSRQRQLKFSAMHAEYHASHSARGVPRLSLTDAGLNTALGGGLLCQRVHLMTANAFSCANTAFSLALIAMMLRNAKAQGPIIWCGPVRGGISGHLFGAGLSQMGLRPEQFIFIRESHPLRRMAACEEALGTKGLSAIIHEYGPLYEKTDLWGKSARRLQLACERGSATAFLIGAPAPASGFESAWHITPSMPSAREATDWRPSFHAQLTHARGGYPASANLIWDNQQARFIPQHQTDATTPPSFVTSHAYDDSLWQKSA